MTMRPDEMSRAELVAHLRSLEARLRDDEEHRRLLHDLQVHQEELEAQQAQLIEARQALETARDLYADLFEFAPLGYVLLDESGVIEEINAAALGLIGVADRARVKRSPLWIFIAQGDRQTFRAHLRVLRTGVERSQTELRLMVRGSNDHRVVEAYSRVWRRGGTEAGRYLTALNDVTERWRAQEERRATDMARRALAEEERALRAANEAKDRFLAALSHELRTPLTPILLSLDALVARNQIPEPIEPTLRMVRRNVEQEARLIDDLLDVTRIAHDKLHCEHEIVELHALLRELEATFGQEAEAAGIGLTVDLLARETHVVGDAVRLKQILSNLLRNAIRHNQPGGQISVRSETPAPGSVRIIVADTGRGIPAPFLQRLFQPFQQADNAHGAGLGLGLAIAKGLVEQHGGAISAHSDGPGTGATFSVDLPTASLSADALEDKAAAGRPTPDVRVLLVEDHADTAEALAMGLTSMGYRVVVAESVAAAVAHADEPFEVVVSDLSLPDGSGLDVMRELLIRRPFLGIVLSGFGAESDVRASREAGFQRHLVKPVELSQLVAAIESLVAPSGNRSSP